jgi:hypothetical protein
LLLPPDEPLPVPGWLGFDGAKTCCGVRFISSAQAADANIRTRRTAFMNIMLHLFAIFAIPSDRQLVASKPRQGFCSATRQVIAWLWKKLKNAFGLGLLFGPSFSSAALWLIQTNSPAVPLPNQIPSVSL